MSICQHKLNQDYNLIWNSYLKKEGISNTINIHLTNRQPYYDTIKKYISYFDHPSVLELGCGTGIDINLIYNENRNIFPCASDLLIKSIEVGCKVRQLFNNKINFFVSDTLEIPMKDNEVDILFSQGLIEHFKSPLAVVKEQARILRKGGFLIINVPQKFTGYTLMKKVKMRNGNWELGWETEYSSGELKKLGRKLGLSELEVAGYQYWKSWKEPVFFLKDFYDKFHRRNPFNNLKIFEIMKNIYDCFWLKLEKKWGHYFCQNIIIVFQKQ